MAKTLKDITNGFSPKSKDEKKFMDKHITVKNKLDDRGTQDDKLFNATNVATSDREPRHGYNPGNDEKVYEEAKALHPKALHVKDVGKGKYKVHAVGKSLAGGIKVGEHLSDSELDDATEMGAKVKMIKEDTIEEKHLTPAEMKKREEIAKGIEKSNPKMPMAKKMAIATATAKKVAEETEELMEGEVAAKQFQHYHNEASKLLKGIHKGLSDHYDNVTNKKNYNNGEAHWGHVGDIKDIHRSLQDLHDRILQQGEYSKPVVLKAMKEEVEELTEDEELTQLLNTIYENLSDENKEIFEQILEEDPDQMIEFLEQLELQDGE
jgi:hypothetical protein